MNKEQIAENNKLIAEFLGWEKVNDLEYETPFIQKLYEIEEVKKWSEISRTFRSPVGRHAGRPLFGQIQKRNFDVVHVLPWAHHQGTDSIFSDAKMIRELRRCDHVTDLRDRRFARRSQSIGPGLTLALNFYRLLAEQAARDFSALAKVHSSNDVRADHADPCIGLIRAICFPDLREVLRAQDDADAF